MPAQKPAATGFLSNCPPHAFSSSPRPHRKHGQRVCVRYFLPSTEECPCGQPFKCTYIFPADLNAADYGIENRKQHDRSSKPNELNLRNEFCSAGNHVAAFERYVVELILIVLEHIYRGVNVPAKQIHHTAGLPKVEMVPNFVVSGFCPPE